MAKYDEEVALAVELVEEFGGDFIMRDPAATDASWPPAEANNDMPIVGVLLRETFATDGKTSFYIAAKDIPAVPRSGMLILKGNDIVGSIAVDGVDELNPDGAQPILYVCRLTTWPNQTI